MSTYVMRRILSYIPVLILVSMFTFGILRIIPGDALITMMGERQGMNPEEMARARAELGLDKPLVAQYLSWIGNGLRGDWGDSFWLHRPVTQAIAETFPVSFQLGVMAFIITGIVALPIGIVSAVKQDSWMDYTGRLFSISFLSVPSFFVAILTIVFLARWFHWTPPRGYINPLTNPWGNLQQMILPALVLGLTFSASTTRLVRTTLLEVLREDYIRTARAKGLQERGVIWKHGVRNAMIPVITYWGISFAALITGSVLIEVVYGLNGMGRLTYDAINQRDWPIVQTGVLFFVVIALSINLLIDLLYGVLDPRIQHS
jgi:peptide/nickel transport system permease protein